MEYRRNFFDEFDAMANKALEAVKRAARRYVQSGAIEHIEELPSGSPLYEVKAALCAALRQEVYQWRPRGGGETAEEKNLMHF